MTNCAHPCHKQFKGAEHWKFCPVCGGSLDTPPIIVKVSRLNPDIWLYVDFQLRMYALKAKVLSTHWDYYSGENIRIHDFYRNEAYAWFGGWQPVPDDVIVKVWFRGNEPSRWRSGGLVGSGVPDPSVGPPNCWGWNHDNDESDIIAYQIIEGQNVRFEK